MKAGWERSNEWILPNVNTVRTILKPFLGEKRVIQIQPLSGGLNNSNIKITTNTNKNYVLRIYSINNKSIHIEREILNLLKDVIPVPQVIYFDFSCTIFSYPFLLLSWVQGRQLSEIIYRGNDKEIVSAANAVGRYLANIHTFKFPSSGFFDENLNVHDVVKIGCNDFLRFIEDSLIEGHVEKYLGREICNRVWEFSRVHAHLIDNLGEQSSLVHSDFNPLNILVEEREDNVCVTGILDWEYAFSGSPLMDIGNMLRYEKATDTNFLNSFISSYQEHGGSLPTKWLQKAKLLDLIALCDLLNKKECGEVRVRDIRRLILGMMEEWDEYEIIQARFV